MAAMSPQKRAHAPQYFVGLVAASTHGRLGSHVSTMPLMCTHRFTDTRLLWLGCTQFPPCNLPVSRSVLLLYCAQTGFYLQAIHYLIFYEVSECVCAVQCRAVHVGSEQ